MKTVQTENLQWINLKKQEKRHISSLQKKYRIHPLIIEEFSTPTLHPKAIEDENCLYLAIHIPLFDLESKTTYPAELDVVICENTLITSSDHDIYQLDQFFENLRKQKSLREDHLRKSPGALLHHLLETLLNSCFPKLDHIAEKLNHIEEQIFSGHEKEMVFELSVVKRDILNFRRTMKPQKTVFESLAQKNYRLIETELKPYYQDLVGTNIRVWNTLESAKETVESLEDTNNSLLSNKLDLTMKVLTIFSAVMLPMTVYSNILAMSADIPFGKNPYGFWIHIGIMLTISLITISVFKIKKWL